jgi:hypothetical protein
MIYRLTFVLLLFASILTACGDRERVNCPLTKNKALRSTMVTVDTASVGTTRQAIETKCP